MAAAQPFISGAISKTINMPNDATIEDCQKPMSCPGRWGSRPTRSIAMARSCPAAAAPLVRMTTSARTSRAAPAREGTGAGREDRRKDHHQGRQERDKLPERRKGYTQKAVVGGHKVYLRTGEYERWQARRDLHRHAQGGRGLPRDDEQLRHRSSVGLQYGVPLEEFVEPSPSPFEPAGMVQGNDSDQERNLDP